MSSKTQPVPPRPAARVNALRDALAGGNRADLISATRVLMLTAGLTEYESADALALLMQRKRRVHGQMTKREALEDAYAIAEGMRAQINALPHPYKKRGAKAAVDLFCADYVARKAGIPGYSPENFKVAFAASKASRRNKSEQESRNVLAWVQRRKIAMLLQQMDERLKSCGGSVNN